MKSQFRRSPVHCLRTLTSYSEPGQRTISYGQASRTVPGILPCEISVHSALQRSEVRRDAPRIALTKVTERTANWALTITP